MNNKPDSSHYMLYAVEFGAGLINNQMQIQSSGYLKAIPCLKAIRITTKKRHQIEQYKDIQR